MVPSLLSLFAATDIDGDGQQMGIETVIAAVIIVGACLTALVFIGKFVVGLLRSSREQSKKFDRFFDDWHGEEARPEAGISARPGVMLRLHSLEENHTETHRTLTSLDAKIDSVDTKVDTVSTKVDTVAAKVQHELTNDHGTSTKDGVEMAVQLATAALTTVQDIQQKQEQQHRELVAWQNRYDRDQIITRQEWQTVFDNIRQMIPMDPKDQVPFWDRIAEAYATRTLVEQNDNTETA